jgi:hypothetical protein
MPLLDRKKRLARLLSGRRLGIVLSDHTDEDGATIFRQACVMGLEGIVEAADRALQVGPVAGLAQGEEPGQPGDDPRAGSGLVMPAREKRKPQSETTGALAARGSRLKITKGSAGNDNSRPP